MNTLPTWNDGRRPDWERLTLRELPPTFGARWAEPVPTLRERAARLWEVVEFSLALSGWLLLVVFAASLTY